MSVQFGRWNFEGPAPAPEYVKKVNAMLAPYGPDSNESYTRDGVRILYRSFCTTKESQGETQPHVFAWGAVLTWDGRLDNRSELIGRLSNTVTLNSPDMEIVAAAFERWGDQCLGKLIGDWALSVWNPREHSLLLAKDPIGVRHLYYSLKKDHVTWSTVLDPLVLVAGKTLTICEEYIANWITNQFPATHLTPYIEIQAVPPSCSVLFWPGRHGTTHTITKYWEFNPDKRIRYRTDGEYEEHFRSAFATAVQRRLRSDRPVLAELSGGMDSSSVVCTADWIMGVGNQTAYHQSSRSNSSLECPRLDTISWFGTIYDIEPDANEFLCISKVEQKRGRSGFHINFNDLKSTETRSPKPFMSAFDDSGFACTPSPRTLSKFFTIYAKHIASQGYRITLSGVGGDFVTGKKLTPMPELQDLLVAGRFVAFARQLNAWGLNLRQGRMLLLREILREFLPHRKVPNNIVSAPWFCSVFIHRNQNTLWHYPRRVRFLGHLPSFQCNLEALESERRIAASWELNPYLIREVRYPYLDRDFLGFMYAIPREQVVSVGQHRFLMRRALAGIVPDEILNRKPQLFLLPDSERDKEKSRLAKQLESVEIGDNTVSSLIGITDRSRLLEALHNVSRKEEVFMRMLTRTLRLESWLRHLASHRILAPLEATQRQDYSLKSKAIRAIASAQKFS